MASKKKPQKPAPFKIKRPRKIVMPGKNTDVEKALKTVEGMAEGLSATKAMIRAGYSESYAKRDGFKFAKRPFVKSIFTDSVDRMLERYGIDFDEIIEPYVKSLKAKVVARGARGATKTQIDDLPQQVIGADRLVQLYGGVPREVEMPPMPAKPMVVNIFKEGSSQVVQSRTTIDQRTQAQVEGTSDVAQPVKPKVTIEKG